MFALSDFLGKLIEGLGMAYFVTLFFFGIYFVYFGIRRLITKEKYGMKADDWKTLAAIFVVILLVVSIGSVLTQFFGKD